MYVTTTYDYPQYLSVISAAGALFHFFIAIQESSVAWPLVHFVCHCVGSPINLARHVVQRDHTGVGVATQAAYMCVLWPLTLKALLTTRRAIKKRGAGPSKVAEHDFFCCLFLCVLPTLLMLLSDTVGCFLSPPGHDARNCENRLVANHAAQIHVAISGMFFLLVTSQEFGLAMTEAACLLLEVTAPEKAMFVLVALSFTLMLSVVCMRDVEGEATAQLTLQASLIPLLWAATWVVMSCSYERILGHRTLCANQRTSSVCERFSEFTRDGSRRVVHHVRTRALPRHS